MEEKNELNDIILNKGDSSGNNKKIILAVATLGVILIIVIMLMSSLTPDAKENLPQPIPLPQKQSTTIPTAQDEPLFEEVIVIEEDSQSDDGLDEIAQKLKQESTEATQITAPQKVTPKPVPKKVVTPKKTPTETTQKTTKSAKVYFVQVGSFSKYKPNKKFLDSILVQGYEYKYHKVTKNSKTLNKVFVGPFYTEKEARTALRNIRTNIEAGAFLIKQ
ncbi:MAG: SPOR domain-containing protein [Campylobacterota bacterium]|nr:SPOR domain-containing protein [Campylobacterota bacterium]